MTRLTKFCAAGLLALLTVPALSVAETAKAGEAGESPEMVKLPLEGPLYMRETSGGTTVIVSEDGRFVMPGRLVDRKEGHTVISTIADAEKLYGIKADRTSKPASKTSSLRTDDGLPNVDNLLSFSVGHGPTPAFVWIDPLCPYCHSVVKMQAELADEFTFHNLIIPVLGERSEQATDALACIPEEDRKEAFLASRYSDVTQDCDYSGLSNSQRLSTILQVGAVPNIISSNLRSVTGAPSSPEQLATFLRGKK